MKIFKTIAVGVLAAGLLAGCGSVSNDPSLPNTESNTDSAIKAYNVTTPSGETVTCVVYTTVNRGGISCDWGKAE